MTPKEIKYIKDKINSDQKDTVLEVIEELRSIGTVEFLNDLIFVLKYSEDEKVKSAIWKFLKDIKEQDAAKYFIEWLQNKDLEDLKYDILSICWQTKLDFSNYMDFYTELLINEDYLSAIEAFTVIENSMDNADGNQKEKCRDKLIEANPEMEDEKRKLSNALIEIISD